jgi:DNA-binding LacI/PurR family transcriptional regulator
LKRISKEEILHKVLCGLARKQGPGSKLPTVRQLCKDLATSPSTVDRVLRRLESERVLNRIQGSGLYVSRYLNQRRIGAVFGWNLAEPRKSSQFWWLLNAATNRVAAQHGDELRSYYGCPTDPEQPSEPSTFLLVDDIKEQRLSGTLAFGVGDEKRVSWLKSAGAPVILFGNPPGLADAVVNPDTEQSVYLGLAGLRDAGCRNIAIVHFVGGDTEERKNNPMVSVIARARKKAGLTPGQVTEWLPGDLLEDASWESLEEAGTRMVAKKWRTRGDKPDGIFFLDDTMAHGGMIALLERGVKLGRDVRVTSTMATGGTLLRPFFHVLSRIEFDPGAIVEAMFDALGEIIEKGKPENPLVLITPRHVAPGQE